MNTLRRAELACARQALITGRLVNALTGAGITPQSLQFSLRHTTDDDFRPLPAQIRFGAHGYFSVTGIASAVLPQQLAADTQAELQYRVTAAGYSARQDSVMLSQNAITAVTTTELLAGHSIALSRIAAPAVHLHLALQPQPVGLTGIVVQDDDLALPLPGVSIQVIAPEVLPTVVSDAQGRFRITALPVVPAVTLQITQGETVTTINHVVDYTMLFNPRIISLTG